MDVNSQEMDDKEWMELAVAEAKRRKISVDKLLRLDWKLCNCKHCKLEKEFSPVVIKRHLALYGEFRPTIGRINSAPSNKNTRSSHQGSSSARGSRGSGRFVPPLHHIPSSPTVNVSNQQSDVIMEDLKSPTGSPKSGSPDIGAPPLGSPPLIDLGTMNEPDPSNDWHRAHIRTLWSLWGLGTVFIALVFENLTLF
ncbi:hypothetical protein RhiLY_03483 [Ceratobasidium sp. AG-Ba]|nr:hypothetical protein RhiLY_03483 [Ceratobasidium sp. AG-Ba]